MGIKTSQSVLNKPPLSSLKNLPTTWGLRPKGFNFFFAEFNFSEKPPHHMGIKTTAVVVITAFQRL